MKRTLALAAVALLPLLGYSQTKVVEDVFEPLPAGNIQLQGYFEDDINNSIDHWVKHLMPYDEVTDFFVHGRKQFALGEMPGKALRSSSMLYRYTGDPELKEISKRTAYNLIATMKSNGSISCTPVENQPGDNDGDIWERKYVLIGLTYYYMNVEKDPKVLAAIVSEANSVLDQVGPAPKKEITTLGWSSNAIESASIIEPMMRTYNITGDRKYLDFVEYVIASGGAAGVDMFQEVYDNTPLYNVALPYSKAYEMTSVWEGLIEYYRVTGNARIKRCIDNFYNLVKDNELTIIGNGGTDIYQPKWNGEAWSNSRYEQTNPDIKRMMETCVGVTWEKYCSQFLRLTGDPSAVDCIESYIYNGLIGAMEPRGKGFSYVNLLNGEKVTNRGWGTNINGQAVTCCNLNGPSGLAYIPFVAVMQAKDGPVVNLYNAAKATARTASGKDVDLSIKTDFPRGNEVRIGVGGLSKAERFTLRLRIPAWSENTYVAVNGRKQAAVPGSYLLLSRKWKNGDEIYIIFDMKAELLDAPEGRNPEGRNFQALQWGPIVLARDENIDADYNKPVQIVADADNEVNIREITPQRPGTRMEFIVPTTKGDIHMVDYSSVDCWNGSHIQTWLPKL